MPSASSASIIGPCELGGIDARLDALHHVFGFTIINDVSSRDPWLDGDQWLLGKSMPGFCPVGPWVVTRGRARPDDLRLWLHDQRRADPGRHDGSTCASRSPRSIAYLSRHLTLRPGDLIATGTPARLAARRARTATSRPATS